MGKMSQLRVSALFITAHAMSPVCMCIFVMSCRGCDLIKQVLFYRDEQRQRRARSPFACVHQGTRVPPLLVQLLRFICQRGGRSVADD